MSQQYKNPFQNHLFEEDEHKQEEQIDYQQFKDLPFYCGDTEKLTRDNCCFNHKISLPVKNGITHPIYDYEDELKRLIETNQHLWCKKARGIGATEFIIRYLAYLALCTTSLDNKSVFIIAGTREEFANEIKERMEALFPEEYKAVLHDSKYTETYIKKTKFKVFPSKNLKDMRGYVDVAYLFIDETDYFNPKEQRDIKYVIKSYEEKSKGKIIMVSTAGEAGGLFEQIENDPNSDFYKHYMLVDKGRGKIFDDHFLEDQKIKDPGFFGREYEGIYGYGLGNIFLHHEIEAACAIKYDPTHINHACPIAMGIDPGFGSSKFGFCILMLEDDIIKVVYAKEFERPSYEDMLSLAVQLRGQYKPQKIYVDGAKPDFIKSLKVQVREPSDYDRIIAQATHDKVDIEYRMKVVPINFNEYGKELLGRAQNVVSKGWFAVSPITHKELVTQMRMARAKENGNLDKEETANSTYDVFDAFRLALKMFNMPRR